LGPGKYPSRKINLSGKERTEGGYDYVLWQRYKILHPPFCLTRNREFGKMNFKKANN